MRSFSRFAVVLSTLFIVQNLKAQNTTSPDVPVPPGFGALPNQALPKEMPPKPPSFEEQTRPYARPSSTPIPPAGQINPPLPGQPAPTPSVQNVLPPPQPQPQEQVQPAQFSQPSLPPQPQLLQPEPPSQSSSLPQAAPQPVPAPPSPSIITPQPFDRAPTSLQQQEQQDDVELIGIKPYFKNKPKLGRLTATLSAVETKETLATMTSDFGDCANCIRGASLKGKLGLRLYGKTAAELTVNRKQSTSIKIENCPGNEGALLSNNQYTCEFLHKGTKLQLTLKLEP